MSIDSFFIHQHCLMSNPLHSLMPDLLRHQGVWEGTYRHVDISGNLLDKYRSRIECIFPEEGQEVYIQKNTYTWPDGRTIETSFGSIIKFDKLFWDTPTFAGYGWIVKPDTFVLDLDRKDDIGARFCEMIVIGRYDNSRSRTWHWFRDGKCFKRTLCDEIKVA